MLAANEKKVLCVTKAVEGDWLVHGRVQSSERSVDKH